MRYIYLDNNATTPCDDRVLTAMLPFFSEEFGNLSSPHPMGKKAFVACTVAREIVAQLLHCTAPEVVFTSGATESNNLVLLGFTSQNARHGIVISSVEHKSIQMPCQKRQTQGYDVQDIGVTADGVVDLNIASDLINDRTALVSVQAANNETGVLQPVQELADIAHSRGALFHCDAAQWIGKLPTASWFDSCDFLSISGHKFYGPKGTGVLMIRNGEPRRSVAPIMVGGGQEGGLRAGTSNVPSIVGLGVACSIAAERVEKDKSAVAVLRDNFEMAVTHALPKARVNGAGVHRLPGSSSLTIPGIPASMVIANLSQMCISEGAACTSGAAAPSHVLIAMGLSREDADSTLRISFGRQNTIQQSTDAAKMIENVVRYLRDEACDDLPGDGAFFSGGKG